MNKGGGNMINDFDKDELFEMLKDFHSVLGLVPAIFDTDYNLVVKYPSEFSPLCALIRGKIGTDACAACDRAACEKAKSEGGGIYLCHAGMTESVIAIRKDNTVLGYIIFGQMLPADNLLPPPASLENICLRREKYGLTRAEIYEAAKDYSLMETEKIAACLRMLEAAALYIITKKFVRLRRDNLNAQIKTYIDGNLPSDLSALSICKAFYISRTKLHTVCIDAFGMSVNKYVVLRRMEKAKELLLESNLFINEIAEKVGYPEKSRFSEAFKKHTGMTPTQYKSNA